MACSYILTLASGIWTDINSPTTTTVSYISGWLVSDQNIGKLNNTISACFSGDGAGCIGPDLGAEEQAIYGEIFKQQYWQKKIEENLGAGGIMWVDLGEGDSRIRRASPTEVAKVYKDMWKESNTNLNRMVDSYKINQSFARSNDFAAP